MAGALNETLARLRGGTIDDSWWRRILNHFGQRYVSPDFLQKPALQAWLADQQVAADFKAVAASRIVFRSEGSAELVARLVESYSNFTGEAHHFADGPVEVVTAVLVAGYIASIPSGQRALAGLAQAGFQNISARFDRLEDGLRHHAVDPITQEAHTQRASAELSSILRMRTFDNARSIANVRTLFTRIREGDLIASHSEIKTKIAYWAARLCATEISTLPMARELRTELVDTTPSTDLTIVDALMAVTTGSSDEALRLVRDHHSPDARTVIFLVLMTTKGEQAALAWADHENSSGDSPFFSGPGWVNWAICSAKLGKWRHAAERLKKLEALWSECPMLAFIAGRINAAMLLPDEFRRTTLVGVPLFPGIRTGHGLLASEFHTRATHCFEFVNEAIAGVDLDVVRAVRDWMLWLRVVDPKKANSESARSEITDRMEDGRDATALILFATSFEIPYDAQPLREYLDRRRGLGGLNDDEILAELLLLQGSIGPRDFVAHIATHRKHLIKVVHPTFLVDMEVEALARDGQLHRAQTLVTERATELGDEHVARLHVFLETVEGRDPRSRLEKLYRRTRKTVDLRNLVSHLKYVGDVDALRPLVVELFGHERRADNALDVVSSLSGPADYDYAAIVRFLESNRDLVSRDDDLKAAYGSALFHGGRIEEAKCINDDLVGQRSDLYDALLDINIAVVSGDWDRIPSVVDREWSKRDSHDGATLMHLASLASGGASAPDRVLALARLATEKAPGDASILFAAFWLHCRLGHERDADPEWLSRAADLSTSDEGPLWRVDLKEAVERWFPRRQDLIREVERKWLGGEIPLAVAAKTFSVSLARMIWHIPNNNLLSLDGRKRVSLPVVSGERGPVEIQRSWTIGLDVTSVMVLEYLGLLEHTIDAFDGIRLSPDVMELLFQERYEVRFHQPSLVNSAKEVEALQHAGRIALAADIGHPPKELIDEVGLEIASLLYLAEQKNGMVVCVLPLRKVESLAESANIGSFDRFVLSTVDFCTLVYDAGRMDSNDYQRAMQIMTRTRQGKQSNRTRSIIEGPVYITDVALSYFQDANILRTVVETISNVLIHENVAKRAHELIEESDHSDEIQAWIDRIRVRLAHAISDGKVSLLPRVRSQDEVLESGGLGWRSATALLMSTSSCDALCVDDRCLNRHTYINATSGKPVPFVCAIDILRHLLSLGAITDSQYWAARHKMRRGGLSLIPLDQEELLHWLSSARVVDGRVIETAELRVLRQSVASTTLTGYLTGVEVTNLNANLADACKATIGRIWQDTSIRKDRAIALSDWLWNNLLVAGVYNSSQGVATQLQEPTIGGLALRLAVLLLPIPFQSEERRNEFTSWLEQSVFSRFRPANSATIEQSLELICDQIDSLPEGQEVYGNLFLLQLPSSARREVILRHPALAKRCGLTLVRTFQMGNDISVIGADLVGAVRRVFASGSKESIEDTKKRGVSVSLDPKSEEIVVRSSRGGETVDTKLPEMSVLAPIKATRREARRRIVNRIGTTGPDFLYPPCDVADRVVTDDEVDLLWSELANGVVARWIRLRRLFDHRAVVTIGDIVPKDVSYYERFCGPLPGERAPDSYLQDILIPYRKKLLERDLGTGIEISLLGALRDDLCPGHWLADIDDDVVWNELARHRTSKNPFVLIAGIDVAAHRQSDPRFREFSEDAIVELSRALFRKDGGDGFQALAASLCDFVYFQIGLVDGCAERPGYWKRMCAWMQAGQIVEMLARSSAPIDTGAMREWAGRNLAPSGLFAGFADLRKEPMWSPARRTQEVWSDEIVGRLCLLKVRHEEAGRGIPGWDRASKELGEAIGKWERGALRLPGPLEGHRIPVEWIPQRVVEELQGMWTRDPDLALRGLSNICLGFVVSETVLEHAREAVSMLSHDLRDNSFERLENAGNVAARKRDVALARQIGAAAVRMAPKVQSREHVLRLLLIILTAAAAHEEHDAWVEWLDETLTSVARSLPDTPSDCLQEFRECLDQFNGVVAMDSWFHLRASAVASSGC